MAENEDGQEKSHEPTGKRLADARRKGQVPRSRELNTMAVTLFGVASLWLMSGHFSDQFWELLRSNFSLAREEVLDPSAVLRHLTDGLATAAMLLLPFFAVMVTVAILASVAIGGFNFSTEALAPKLDKLNPIKGMKKLFTARGLLELVKALVKFFLIGGTTAWLLYLSLEDFVDLGRQDIDVAAKQMVDLLGWSTIVLACTFILLAMVDIPFQLWDHKRQLKMTMKELRDEMKETEGNPEMRGRVRQMQREIAQRRMMQEVPNADVIVTNPTHFAVALKYDQDKMAAPLVVAKGSDLVAGNIRKVAMAHEVPIVEAPLLARAIYFSTELNSVIPAGLYLAVAQLLAYVFQIRVLRREGGDIPQPPSEFPVPDEFKYDTTGHRRPVH